MEYKVVTESPVGKTIEISVSPEEVQAFVAGAIELNKKDVQIDGYRKGKVPSNVIEKLFHDAIYKEAKENLINVNLNEVLQKMNDSPIGGMLVKGDEAPLQKGETYKYTVEYELLPKFDLPVYEGLEVEQNKTVIDDKELEQVYQHFLQNHATLEESKDIGPARDGQFATIDFEAFENDKPVKDLKTTNFDFELGANAALPEFETLVKGIPVGNTGEGKVHFPDDFFVKDLQGKDLTMKVKVHGIKEKVVPKLDDDFAKRMGFKSADDIKSLLLKSYQYSADKLEKGVAEKKLLDQLLKQTDFPLPPRMVEMQGRLLLGELMEKLEREGKTLQSTGKKVEEILTELKPQSEELTRTRILLLSIAQKENLDISYNELEKAVMENSIRKGENFQDNMDKLERTGMLNELRDHLLGDKAMDLIYERAQVKMIDPEPEKTSTLKEAPESEKEAQNLTGEKAE